MVIPLLGGSAVQVRSFKCEDHLWVYVKEKAEEQGITIGEFLRQLIQKDMKYSGVKFPRNNKKKPGVGENLLDKKIIRGNTLPTVEFRKGITKKIIGNTHLPKEDHPKKKKKDLPKIFVEDYGYVTLEEWELQGGETAEFYERLHQNKCCITPDLLMVYLSGRAGGPPVAQGGCGEENRRLAGRHEGASDRCLHQAGGGNVLGGVE